MQYSIKAAKAHERFIYFKGNSQENSPAKYYNASSMGKTLECDYGCRSWLSSCHSVSRNFSSNFFFWCWYRVQVEANLLTSTHRGWNSLEGKEGKTIFRLLSTHRHRLRLECLAQFFSVLFVFLFGFGEKSWNWWVRFFFLVFGVRGGENKLCGKSWIEIIVGNMTMAFGVCAFKRTLSAHLP